MTFSDISTKFGLLTGNANVSAANRTIYLNTALNRVTSLILKADSLWQFDDTNQTDLPIATTGLVANQQDYSLATTHLTIDRVELKDQSGNWIKLAPIDRKELEQESLTDFLKTAGTPAYYDLVGNSVFLYPKPSYTQSASLKPYFTRGPLEFSYTTNQFTDGTGSASSTPGFNSLFHNLVPLWMAYEYGIANDKSNVPLIYTEIQRKEQELHDFYGLRERDSRRRMTTGGMRTMGAQSGRLFLNGGDSNK